MIGFYDYTVILTYLSLLSAGIGIVVSLSGQGHPFIGIYFLMFCGLCDTFDGRVARRKKDRTEIEKKFGVQIDSLSDLVAFGVLPACIGAAMFWRSPMISTLISKDTGFWLRTIARVGLFGVLVLYILAALIRLAYFNVLEEERQAKGDTSRLVYTGLPVTSASLIFPAIGFLQFLTRIDITIIYFIMTIVTGVLFISKIKIKKPTSKGIYILIGAGALEFILLIVNHFFLRK